MMFQRAGGKVRGVGGLDASTRSICPGPEGGRLVGRVNRPTDIDDSKNNFRRVLTLPTGKLEDQMILNIGAPNARYNDRLEQFCEGHIAKAGFTDIPSVNYVPGYNKPIPPDSFSNPLPPQVCKAKDSLSIRNNGGCP